MEVRMEEVCDKECVFEESFYIDFDYEFDVAKFFDFLRPETREEVEKSELWFHFASGYPPSPLIVKLDLGAEDFGESDTSSPKYEYQYSYSSSNADSDVSSVDQGKKDPQLKSKPKSKSCLSKGSRLLQPTASHLAKKDQTTGARGTRAPGRHKKIGSPPKTPGDLAATKRQKLDIGYLRKVANLKHQTSFSHKLAKKVGSPNTRPKATVPKEPDLQTANRAQRPRSRNTTEESNASKLSSNTIRTRPLDKKMLEPNKNTRPHSAPEIQGGSVRSARTATKSGTADPKRTNVTKLPQQENSDQVYRFKARQLNKKIFASKGDIGVFRNCKKKTTIPKEFKLSSSKKYGQKPPIELFSKLSLNSEDKPNSLLEEDQSLQTKGLKKDLPCSIMKENKNLNTTIEKPMSCYLKQNRCSGGRVITDIGNHVTSTRGLTIY